MAPNTPAGDALLTLAARQLSLPSALSVPASYIDELQNHLDLYPYDTQFRVTLQPKRGLGTVTCLEDGCNNIAIPLIERVKTKDGGLRDGFGSLASYRVHIESHPTHKKNRLARIKSGGALAVASPGPSRVILKREDSSVLNALNSSPFGTPQSRSVASSRAPVPSSSPAAPSTSASSKPLIKRSSLVRVTPRNVKPEPVESTVPRAPPAVKPEPIESTIPRKRLSDTAFDDNHHAVVKKVRQEAPEHSKLPLAQAQVNLNRKADTSNTAAAAAPIDVAEIRAKMASTQTLISHLEGLHDRMQRKKKKTKADLTRMGHHARELQRLRKMKGDLDASLPRAPASPIKRTASLNKALGLGGAGAVVAPNPMHAHAHPALYNPTAASGAPAFYNPALAQLTKLKAEPQPYLNPFGFGAPAYGDVKPAAYDVKPQYINAVASSSKIPAALSDDEMDVDPVMSVVNKYGYVLPHIAPVGDSRDENGDFHGRGRDTFMGPQAKADDIDKFLIEAGNAELFDGNDKVETALEKLGLQSTHELLPSLDIPLMPHQLLCVAWMVDNEKIKTIKGGCLADEMGLGKTVQMIACMCKNPSDDPACKTTLIIAPLALLGQWKQEISNKTNADWKVLIYHGSQKPKKKADLLQYDVVLTTFSTMALEWPDYEAEAKKKEKAKRKKPADDFIATDSDDSGSDRPKTKGKKARGLLFQVDFYRVVLDEAHNIRNKRTRVSRAVTDLNAKYRWCLTATPIVNSLLDCYGYIRFLKIRPWYDWQEYNGHVTKYEKKNPQLAVTRLQAILNLYQMRRTKTTLLDGKRLIELPEKTVELVSLEFSQEERDIYDQVEKMQQAKFNRFLRAGTVLKNYASVLVLLLRLRQLCSHPALIQENGTHFLAADEVDDPEEYRNDLSRARVVMSKDWVQKMKEKFKERALSRMQAERQSQDAVAEVEDCPICFDALTSAVVTACGHEFCKDCLENVLEAPLPEQAGNGNDHRYKADERPCPACRSPICSEKLFPSAAFEPTDKDLQGDADADDDDSDIEMLDAKPAKAISKGKGKAKATRPARKASGRKFMVLDSSDVEGEAEQDSASEDSDMSDFIVESDEDEEEKDARLVMKNKRLGKRRAIKTIVDSDDEIVEAPEEREILFGKKPRLSKAEVKLMPRFLPSTKMKAMMEVLQKLAEDHPDEKTLIVSQWTGCLNIVSDYLTENGILHVKYQGDMTTSKREQAVQHFMSKDKARVMLMSLKCGGVGLNLTRANNVISLDLGWSPAIDQQAFDRVHRLGQHRKVIVKRMVIANTVEDRILALQERKQSLADGSLGEGKGKKLGKLSVRELAELFNLDSRGRVLAK
ncbi:putative ATP-dependent helicase C23E6.02 [Mycena venus]|uniref:Putative ATP-dependent helicase C23E6.02 n=1 Tax=Mycena venus TaxID=2733690 RepID=A0A8H6Y1I9_9AGAR|nr:putative ATP-dependent helicase C23E6.02 [Mycena venus]